MKEPQTPKEVAWTISLCLAYLAGEAFRAGLVEVMAKITAVAHDVEKVARKYE